MTVFDRSGGFWFTDHGKSRERERDITGVFYVDSRGESCREVVFPLNSPNGIGLSPNGSRLYVAETLTGRLFAYDVISPGKLKTAKGNLIYSAPEGYMFDSLAVDSEGNICVATLGRGSWGTGGISVIKENGTGLRNFITTGDFFTTNICFGGIDLQDAYITLSVSLLLALHSKSIDQADVMFSPIGHRKARENALALSRSSMQL